MREIMDISSTFFEIVEYRNAVDGSFDRYYGGNQEWFEERISKMAACGTIAATNVYINSFLKQEKNPARIDKEEYMEMAKLVHRFVYPAQIFGIPIGIWPSSSFIKKMNRFLDRIGEKAEFSKFSPSSDTKVLLENIVESLKARMPLFMLIGITSRFQGLPLEYPGGYRVIAKDASMHWVTILGLYENGGEYYVKTSSWGGILFLKLSDWQKSLWPSKILRMKKGTTARHEPIRQADRTERGCLNKKGRI